MEGLNAATSGRPIIRIQGLSIGYVQDERRTEILRSLDLSVARGEFVAIVGSSGVGKSTLLRILMRLSRPTAGTVEVNRPEGFDADMALVFQDARLLPWRRILSNVAFGLEKLKMTAAQRRERAMDALALVGLKDLARRFPHQLSGGQRQRVALARALAVRPAILLMDEPFSALDIATRETLQDEIARIHAQTETTILFVTHDIGEAVYLADRVVALGGKPGEVKSELRIEAGRPRRRSDPLLAAPAATIRNAIAAEAAQEDWSI